MATTILIVTTSYTPPGELRLVTDLSVTEYAVLGVLAEGPSHGFALAKELNAEADVGRIFTVRVPLVYRALDRLVEHGYAEPAQTERGDSGPNRVVHRVTRNGRRRIRRWLDEPVSHVRDIRIEFLLKLALLRRSNRSPVPLITAQRDSLRPTIAALDEPDIHDHVELWRRHNARAAWAYLEEMLSIYG